LTGVSGGSVDRLTLWVTYERIDGNDVVLLTRTELRLAPYCVKMECGAQPAVSDQQYRERASRNRE